MVFLRGECTTKEWWRNWLVRKTNFKLKQIRRSVHLKQGEVHTTCTPLDAPLEHTELSFILFLLGLKLVSLTINLF